MENENNDQKNLFLAFALSLLVLLGWAFVGKPSVEQTQKDAYYEQQDAEAKAAEEANKPAPLQTRETVINSGQRIKIDTPSLSGSFLVQGSRFDDIKLKNYKKTLAADSSDVVMLTPEGAEKAAYIFDNWVKPDSGTGANLNWEVVSGDVLTADKAVVLAHHGNGYHVERTITADEKFLITLSDKVTNTSDREIALSRKGVARQHGLPDDLTNFFILHEGPISIVDGKLHDMKYSALRKKRVLTEVGAGGWAGLTDKYWLTATIPPQGKAATVNFNYKPINDVEVYETNYALDPITITPGTTISSDGYVFAGAKDRSVLVSYQKDLDIDELERAIDWGNLRLLTRPMTSVLSYLGKAIGNYGLAIMALTLIIKIFMFPLFNKQYESQAKMKKVQPKMKKLQTLYKDDRMKLQQEMMALYRKEGVNPVAGCLPIIPTIFIFFALYKTVLINVELRHAPFFGWIQDLSARDPLSILNGFGLFPWDSPAALGMLAIGPLALLYGITMALMYTLTPTPTASGGAADDIVQMQTTMFKFMPWIFMFILAPFATGLLVYWVWNNVLSFGQQYYITRKFEVDTPIDKFFRKITGKEKAAE